MHRIFRGALLPMFLMGIGMPSSLGAQDIELLGKIHGTRPPQGYYDLLEKDPGAFQYRRALFRRGLGIRDLPEVRAPGQVLPATFDRAFAQLLREHPDRAPVTGTFSFPLILGLFSDSPPIPSYAEQAAVQAEFFDGPQANPNAVGTIPDFYSEISGGRVTLTGTTFPWQATNLTQFQVTAGVSGLGPGSRVGEFIVLTLESLDDGSVDWGLFDNDGPDGTPNSGDDDGYVDVLAVMHPTPGGECASGDRPNRIWSHRWNLYWNAQYYGGAWTSTVRQAVLDNNGYVTRSVSANDTVPFIKVLDYTVQPVQTCGGDAINYIGVFAHELGHGFGLPDLYVTTNSQDHEGIGNWGLMGTGSWGCDGRSAWSPCHMSAWSKEVLGWADVQLLGPDMDLGVLSLPPVEASGQIFRIDSGDGSSEYVLLENRQRLGFDENLFESGLLVWQIDPVTIEERPNGGVNNDPDRMGVWLRQADGLNELGEQNGGRGDDGDPFPGSTGNTAFHAGSNPGSWTHGGAAMGVTLLDIGPVGLDMAFRILTRYQTLTVRTEGSPSGAGLVSVDGSPPGTADWMIDSAPFQQHLLEAAPGEQMTEGVRVGFQGWTDGGPRIREHTTELEDASFTATYGGLEYLVNVTPTSPAVGIVPGSIDFDVGDGTGWIPEGETVTVTASPRTGFQFLEWTAGMAGLPNPASLTPTGPVESDARFDIIFSAESNPSTVTVQGGIPHTLTLTVENANLPVLWTLSSGSLPSEMLLAGTGSISGTPLERGDFPLTLRALDAIGLQAFLPMNLVVEDPEAPAEALASAFLLKGPPLSADIRVYLDRAGNNNDAYDLGDFRAYVLRNPGLASYQSVEPFVEIVVPLGSLGKTSVPGEAKREEMP